MEVKKTQTNVSRSLAEAEYRAMTNSLVAISVAGFKGAM